MEDGTKKRRRIEESINVPRRWHTTWGGEGSGDGQFRNPRYIRVAKDGNIYICDRGNHRIQCFNLDGKFIRKWGRNGTADGEFNWPVGLAIGVDDGLNESLMKAMMSIPEVQALPPGLLPICVAYVGEEHIIVADHSNDRMQVFKTDGRFVRKWGSHGSTDGLFIHPTGCDIDGEGLVYIADTGNYRIQVFKWDGSFVRKWGSRGERGSGVEQFGSIVSVSVSVSHKLIYIADPDNYRIICCNLDGTASRQLPVGALALSIFVDDEEEAIYVCDYTDGLKKLNTTDCALIRSWGSWSNGSWGNGYGQLGINMTLATGLHKWLYIADRDNHRIIVTHLK